jgi:peptidoglycan/LPS O-acetylase OafA/YrhL
MRRGTGRLEGDGDRESPPPGWIPELDGVRGVAILLVLLFHFQGVRPPGVPKLLIYPMILGWSGVDLFFVLSGFLITGILVDTRGSPSYFESFYVRRCLRILPLYLLAVFLCFRVGLPLAEQFGRLEPGAHLERWYWLHISNWKSAFGEDVRPLSHFWSLSIEEQFYLVWPIVVWLVPPRRLAAVCAAIAVAVCAARCGAAAAGVVPEALHRLTVFRMDGLALGGLVAVVARTPALRAALRRRLGAISGTAGALLAALLVVGRGATSLPMVTLGYTAFALVDACFVFAAFDAAGSPGGLARQMRRPLLRRFGKYSYGIYVFHYAVAILQASWFDGWATGASVVGRIALWASSIVFGIAASFALALVSWNLVEKRFLALKRRFPPGAPAEHSV